MSSITNEKKIIVFQDRTTGTIWIQKENCACGVCENSLMLCRGCGGMSMMYERLFGSCGDTVICPNCVTLSKPDIGWHHNISADKYFLTDIVFEEKTNTFKNLSFLTYIPKTFKNKQRFDPSCGECSDNDYDPLCEYCIQNFPQE